jgi:GMP synthase (glutamine-hydrolysing)
VPASSDAVPDDQRGADPNHHDTVLVVDFGAQYAQLIARRVREERVYSEIVARTMPLAEMLATRPVGIIFSGGPASVHVEGAPSIDPGVYDAGIPILGICYGAQLVAQQLGGEVERTGGGEYGRTPLTRSTESTLLLRDLPESQQVWMSHGDAITAAPEGFVVTASSPGAPVAALEDRDRAVFGVQFHPEVVHTERGQDILRAFLFDVCAARPTWTRTSIIEEAVDEVRSQVGAEHVLCGLSGGVDSAVAAALVHRAIGDQLTCVFVDTGLLRLGEAEQVEATFREQFQVDLVHVKAADRFIDALAGVTDPEDKRKIIGETFIRVFEEVARGSAPLASPSPLSTPSASGRSGPLSDAGFLVQGTLYPDIVESGGGDNAMIKSHHNVGGLPDDMAFELVEPLRNLFKDEVRAIGEELGLPADIVWRQPFPGPGLAVRVIGDITRERLETLRLADHVVVEEIRRAGLYREIWQSFAVLPAVRTVGVMGDGRTYEYPVIVRAVTSEDAMTADWARLPHDLLERIASRIINEVPGVNRVAYDITSKPPGTIEWE